MSRNSVDLFGEIATKENIVEAVKKYGHVTISEQERRRGGSICRSCFNLLKGIKKENHPLLQLLPVVINVLTSNKKAHQVKSVLRLN